MTQLEDKKIKKRIGGLAEEEASYLDDKSIDKQFESLVKSLDDDYDREMVCSAGKETIEKAIRTRNERSENGKRNLDRLVNECR